LGQPHCAPLPRAHATDAQKLKNVTCLARASADGKGAVCPKEGAGAQAQESTWVLRAMRWLGKRGNGGQRFAKEAPRPGEPPWQHAALLLRPNRHDSATHRALPEVQVLGRAPAPHRTSMLDWHCPKGATAGLPSVLLACAGRARAHAVPPVHVALGSLCGRPSNVACTGVQSIDMEWH
jgi:hypothetical protein